MKYKVGDRVVVDGEVVEISGVLENLDMYNFKDSDITSKLEDEIDHVSTQQLRDGLNQEDLKTIAEILVCCQRELSGEDHELTVGEVLEVSEKLNSLSEVIVNIVDRIRDDNYAQALGEGDSVNHPSHYTTGSIEVIDYIEDKGFNYNLGNAIKYISRCEHKGNKVQDLRKAIFYLNREIDTKREGDR